VVKVIFFSFDFFNLINEKNINEFKRFWETYGEDTYVASKIGETYVKSHEGNDLKNKNSTICKIILLIMNTICKII
jgi:hypothetical protein